MIVMIKIWCESPAPKPLSFGSSTTCGNGNINVDNFSDDSSSYQIALHAIIAIYLPLH